MGEAEAHPLKLLERRSRTAQGVLADVTHNPPFLNSFQLGGLAKTTNRTNTNTEWLKMNQ